MGRPQKRRIPPKPPASGIDQEVSQLYQLFAPRLLRYARLFANDLDMGQEAVQESFMRFYVARTQGEIRYVARAWFFRVVRNYLLDRKKESASRYSVDIEEALDHPDARQNPEAEYARSEAFQQCLDLLAPRERECMRLRAEGLRYEEIAKILVVDVGTVGAMLARGENKIRKSHRRPKE